MIRTAIYTILGLLASIPTCAKSGHDLVMHHWDDVRYIKEIHFQIAALLVIALILGAFIAMRRRRKLA